MKTLPAIPPALLALLLCGPLRAQTPALPEPGLFIYGPVVNRTTQQPVTATNVSWQVSGGGDAVSLGARLVNINGRVFHVTRVPFETRSVGTANLSRTPGTLELKASATTYTRVATVNGLPATVVSSSRNTLGTFPFGIADRGITEEVTLGAEIVPDGDRDSDGDGQTDAEEAIAGTSPNDRNSFFRILPALSVNAQGGIVIRWDSLAGRRYSVLRSTSLVDGFGPLASNVAATPPQNSFSDSNPPDAAVVYYRITVSN
jgi:hypothetical protein